jgi:hypothetical protein
MWRRVHDAKGGGREGEDDSHRVMTMLACRVCMLLLPFDLLMFFF